jgi:nitrogen fixation protein FixH
MHPWAVGVTVVVVAFPLVFVGLAVWMSSIDVPLVRKDYYERDLQYQKEIDTRKRTNALPAQPEILLAADYATCTVAFPPADSYRDISGTLSFYRVDDNRRDFDVALQLDAAGRQDVATDRMNTGQWIVKLRWNTGGDEYYLEKRIYKQ